MVLVVFGVQYEALEASAITLSNRDRFKPATSPVQRFTLLPAATERSFFVHHGPRLSLQ
jgi:hypothetical protein